MSNTDSSASARLQQIKARTLATYRANNPLAREGGGAKSADASVVTERAGGLAPVVRVTDRLPAQVEPGCCGCVAVGAVNDISVTLREYDEETGYFIESYAWIPDPNVTSYTFSTSWPSMTFSNTLSSVTVTYQWVYTGPDDPFPEFTITAVNACSSATSAPVQTNPCFLAGSLVAMADGSQKPIEEVQVGDAVLGAFGEINYVLALHRPLMGAATMIRINDEHSSTAHHPHIGADRRFYSADVSALAGTYGQTHEVFNAAGEKEMRFLSGLKAGRVVLYEMGMALKTAEGSRALASLETYSMPADTQLYNLVVSGSHTYHVDGYAVTGWPSEEDFDYDAWAPIAAQIT
jgi:hypothetical protein